MNYDAENFQYPTLPVHQVWSNRKNSIVSEDQITLRYMRYT